MRQERVPGSRGAPARPLECAVLWASLRGPGASTLPVQSPGLVVGSARLGRCFRSPENREVQPVV